MFCSECGTKSTGGKFCSNCGNELKHNEYMVANGSDSNMYSDVRTANKFSSLGDLLQILEAQNLKLVLSSVINIESGDMSFRAATFPSIPGWEGGASGMDGGIICESRCEDTEIGIPFFVECKFCGRSPENYFWIKAGDGDGLYVVFAIRKDSEDWDTNEGFIVVCVPTDAFAQPLVDDALTHAPPHVYSPALFEQALNLECFHVTDLRIPKEDAELFITDKSTTKLDSRNATENLHFSDSDDTKLVVFAFSEPLDVEMNSESILTRDLFTKHMGKQIEFPELDMRPRIIVGINEVFLRGQKFQSTLARPFGEEIYHWWESFAVGAAHLQEMWDAAVYFSAMLQPHPYLKLSWILQGALHGDEDCRQLLNDPEFSDYLSDPKMVSVMLAIRSQKETASEIYSTGKLPSWLQDSGRKNSLRRLFSRDSL